MLIIVDARLPELIKDKLSRYGSVLELSSEMVVYDAISGHPDVFMCDMRSRIVVAPNAPVSIFSAMVTNHTEFIKGSSFLGRQYPETSFYNAVVTQKYLIHNLNHTDTTILELAENKILIHVNQAYTRCNLLFLNKTHFITSDKGIESALLKHGLNGLFVNPEKIELAGFPHGFIGGCCGLYHDQLFVNGSIKYLSETKSFGNFIPSSGIEIVELYDGPLIDSGSIFFVNP